MADVHALAVDAERAAEKLATALGQEGASEEVLANVSQCADLFRQVVEALGHGQEEQPDHEPASIDQAAAETHKAMQASASKSKNA